MIIRNKKFDRPIVFLDIDGVLNSSQWYEETRGKLKKNLGDFDYKAVERLNRLTDATNAVIVETSTWRFDEDYKEVLKDNGIKAEVIGRTPSLRHIEYFCRGNEIAKYIIDNNPHTIWYDFINYVILDDDGDMLNYQLDNFIKVNREIGLSDNDIEKAVKILTTDSFPLR